MFEPTIEGRITLFMNTAMIEWPDLQQGLFEETKGEMVAELDSLIIRAARPRGYIDRRRSGTHREAVRESNNLATQTRRALGYTQARLDLNF